MALVKTNFGPRFVGIVGLLDLVILLSGCGGLGDPAATRERLAVTGGDARLDVLGEVPEFTLTDQTGEPYGSGQLHGKPWIANFIFTRCATTCPQQTNQLVQLARHLQKQPLGGDVRLISFSVEPEYDTPEVLQKYTENAHVDNDRWKFLTGDRRKIWKLSKDGFKLPVGETSQDGTGPIMHSPRFVLVDRQGKIRGYYDGLSSDGMKKIRRDLKSVLAEEPSAKKESAESGFRAYVPSKEEVLDVPWLAQRQEAQLESARDYNVFCDFQFNDEREASGITFRHKIVQDSGKVWRPNHYDHGNGVAIADVDGDGRYDIYFSTMAGSNQLWRNLGDGRFKNITQEAGVGLDDRIGISASFADMDNDGDSDLYVTSLKSGNVLFENDGNGGFTNITATSGLGYEGHSSGAVFFDYNRDGLLDIYLTNVGQYTTDVLVRVESDSTTEHDGGGYYYYVGFADAFAGHLKPLRAERSVLYKNLGNNRFVDVSEEVGLMDTSWSGDATPLDVNKDGWSDLYVLNMQGQDEYYENEEGKHFARKSREVFPKTPWGAMGIKVFDFENDGDMDVYVTDMHSDMSEDVGPEGEKLKSQMQWPESFTRSEGKSIWGNAFYRNDGQGHFEEISDQIGAENYWPWGMSVADLNADGYDDVFITSSMNFRFRYGINSVLLNDHGEKFLDSEFVVGVEPRRDRETATPWFELDCDDVEDKENPNCQERNGRGVAYGVLGSRSSVIFDLDGDGDLDIVTNDFNSKPMVLVSNLTEKKPDLHFLKVKLVGRSSNRDGLGAVVKVRTDATTYTKVHDGKSGYLSQSVQPLYFGLGNSDKVDQVEVQWPSGQVQVISEPIKINELLVVHESPK